MFRRKPGGGKRTTTRPGNQRIKKSVHAVGDRIFKGEEIDRPGYRVAKPVRDLPGSHLGKGGGDPKRQATQKRKGGNQEKETREKKEIGSMEAQHVPDGALKTKLRSRRKNRERIKRETRNGLPTYLKEKTMCRQTERKALKISRTGGKKRIFTPNKIGPMDNEKKKTWQRISGKRSRR